MSNINNVVNPATENNWETVEINRKNRDLEIIYETFKKHHQMQGDDPMFREKGYFIYRHFTNYPWTKEDLQEILNKCSMIDPKLVLNPKQRMDHPKSLFFLSEVLVSRSCISLFIRYPEEIEGVESFDSFFTEGLQIIPDEKLEEYRTQIGELNYYEKKYP